jgi:hypothetical protein
MLVGTHVKASFSVEIAGSGAATTKPAYDILLQCSGYAGAAGASSYDYTRVAAGSEKDGTFYLYKDSILHKITGAISTASHKLNVGELPTMDFEITGLYGGVVTGTMPTADFSTFIVPEKVGATHTTLLIAGTEYKMLGFELDEGNEVIFDENTVEERVYLIDYKGTGKITIEAPALGTFDPFATALAEQQLAIKLTHGTTAGNIFEINIPAAQLERTTYGDKDGRVTYEIPFRVIGSHTISTM